MGNQEAYDQIKELFQALEMLDNLEKLEKFIDKHGLQSNIDSFYVKYPVFDFNLTLEDVNLLKTSGVIDLDHKLEAQNFPNDPLAKLLAALLWKNGDIHKVQHLLDGITGREGDRSPNSLIFKQYGASLANDMEPIVDQHVLRAFEIYSLVSYSEPKVDKIRKKALYKSSDKPLLDKYRIWFEQIIKRVTESERTYYKDILDKIIFIKGKAAKS